MLTTHIFNAFVFVLKLICTQDCGFALDLSKYKLKAYRCWHVVNQSFSKHVLTEFDWVVLQYTYSHVKIAIQCSLQSPPPPHTQSKAQVHVIYIQKCEWAERSSGGTGPPSTQRSSNLWRYALQLLLWHAILVIFRCLIVYVSQKDWSIYVHHSWDFCACWVCSAPWLFVCCVTHKLWTECQS